LIGILIDVIMAKIIVGQNFLHSHPQMEQSYVIPPDHVIVDRQEWITVSNWFNSHPEHIQSLLIASLGDEEKIKELRKIIALNKTGYAGVMPNGNIVDRREHPEAIPVQENRMLGVVKPKPVKKSPLAG
jgi:hypothetical protein